ncbi:MAG: peptidyl-prolyl cis-trans isomerase [Myxococcota bacterium]|nr:peptidyl-prolyl cis-trans isomerase [Myxococcota bacterium]
MSKIIQLTFFLPVFLFGCQKDGATEAAKGSSYVLAGETNLSAQEQGQVVAKIGPKIITLQAFERYLNQQSVFARSRHNSPERKKDFLDNLIRFELLAAEAAKKGYNADPDVQLAMKQAMVKRFTSQELSKIVKMSDITDAEIKTYYDAHPSEFSRAAQVRASHILVADKASALTLHAEIKAAIAAAPAKARRIFGEFAEKHSKDALTQGRKGDLGFFGEPGKSAVKRAHNAPPVPSSLAKAAYKLDAVGQMAPEPVEGTKGWHLVLKSGYRRAYVKSLADVRNKLRIKLFRQRKSTAMEAYVKTLLEKAEINIDEAALQAAKAKRPTRPMPSLAPPKSMLNKGGAK